MLLKIFLWRKPGDGDYLSPKINIINKDLFTKVMAKPKRIIEAISLK
jgi:hypothetical protein